MITKNKLNLIIGGPGSGKSTLLNHIEKNGFTCFHEISREIILKAQQEGIDQLFLEKPLLFSEMLLEGRINQYVNGKNTNQIVFIDRGIPDVVAYLDFINQDYPNHFIKACENHSYDQIFILPPWEEIYISDNERYESFEQALEIHHHLIQTYKKFGYQPIEVPKDTVENRYDFIINNL